MARNIDEFERTLGKISSYQVFVILFAALALFGTGSMNQSSIFFSAVPKYRCLFGKYEDLLTDVSEEIIHSSIIPPQDPCHKYSYNLSRCNISIDEIICDRNSSEITVEKCDHGYAYDKTYFHSTTVTEWNLVCDRTYFDALANSLYYVGMFIGSFAVGISLDWFGRRRTLLIIIIVYSSSGVVCSYSPSYAIFVATRVVVGSAAISYFIAYFTYASEIGGRKYRLRVGFFCNFVSAIDHTILPVVAYLVNDWRNLCLILSLLPISLCVVFMCIPESPRWLLAHGREHEAKTVLKRMVQNKEVEFSEAEWADLVEIAKNQCDAENEKVLIGDLFRTPRMRLVSLITIFNWFACAMVYYGLILNVGMLFGDPYVNRTCNGLGELFGVCLYIVAAHYFGRKNSLFYGFMIAGLSCLLTMLFSEFADGRQWMLHMSRWAGILGKVFASLVFGLLFQHTGEAYPTIARGTALSMASMSGRVGAIVMPWTLELQHTYSWLTQTIFGGMSLLAGVLCLLLPETNRSNMTTTLQEANEFYRREMHLANTLIFRRDSTISSKDRVSHSNIQMREDAKKDALLEGSEENEFGGTSC